ncbi:MAG: Spy/CpxP family protein refolding chaperone [Methylococcaceae bacterium]|nr:Spy/CpxP family protein refolding chaperone [Methylococcaceae bacterium]
MKKLSAISIASMIALGAFASSLPAAEDPHAGHGGKPQEMPGGPGGGMHEMMKHMEAMREHEAREHQGYAEVVLRYTNELKLSDEQIGKITRLHQANQQKVEEIGKKIREGMKTAHEVFLNPASDEAAIRNAAKAHSAAFDELIETVLKARSEINAVLTPEQLKLLKSK